MEWQYTAEQVSAIKSGDMQAISKFIFDNERRLRNMAWAFLRKRLTLHKYAGYCVDDFFNQLFIDLPLFKFDGEKAIKNSVCDCFRCVVFGGGISYKCEPYIDFSLSQPVENDNEDLVFGGLVADSSPSPLELVERQETEEESAASIYACVRDIVVKMRTSKEQKERFLRELLERVFVGYTYEQVRRMAGGCYE